MLVRNTYSYPQATHHFVTAISAKRPRRHQYSNNLHVPRLIPIALWANVTLRSLACFWGGVGCRGDVYCRVTSQLFTFLVKYARSKINHANCYWHSAADSRTRITSGGTNTYTQFLLLWGCSAAGGKCLRLDLTVGHNLCSAAAFLCQLPIPSLERRWVVKHFSPDYPST